MSIYPSTQDLISKHQNKTTTANQFITVGFGFTTSATPGLYDTKTFYCDFVLLNFRLKCLAHSDEITWQYTKLSFTDFIPHRIILEGSKSMCKTARVKLFNEQKVQTRMSCAYSIHQLKMANGFVLTMAQFLTCGIHHSFYLP